MLLLFFIEGFLKYYGPTEGWFSTGLYKIVKKIYNLIYTYFDMDIVFHDLDRLFAKGGPMWF